MTSSSAPPSTTHPARIRQPKKRGFIEMIESPVHFVVSRIYVKRVKSALEQSNDYGKPIKIRAEEKEHGSTQQTRMVLQTSQSFRQTDLESDRGRIEVQTRQELLRGLGLDDLNDNIEILLPDTLEIDPDDSVLQKPLLRALAKAIAQIPGPLLESLTLTPAALLSTFPVTYSIYKPMLLLPSHAFVSPSWTGLLTSYPPNCAALQRLWKTLAATMGVTHIAINASIPLSTINSTPHSSIPSPTTKENILRSPVNLTPLYGDFGPPPTPSRQSFPTKQDFDTTLWVSTCQNGIYQIWAPLYTMFSRGNIREKTRLLTLPSVLDSVFEGTAVDLYAGIGYFAFSYKKAGMGKIICWELNRWSIEGLRRGAERNGWTTHIFRDVPTGEEGWKEWVKQVQDVDFLVFQQSNEEAGAVVHALVNGGMLGPIRHVNCGFLPSSRGSWETAVRVMDGRTGGWVHAHENVGVNDLETKKKEVVAEIQGYLNQQVSGRSAKCDHVERVKTYAPGVVHVVFDVWVGGSMEATKAG